MLQSRPSVTAVCAEPGCDGVVEEQYVSSVRATLMTCGADASHSARRSAFSLTLQTPADRVDEALTQLRAARMALATPAYADQAASYLAHARRQIDAALGETHLERVLDALAGLDEADAGQACLDAYRVHTAALCDARDAAQAARRAAA